MLKKLFIRVWIGELPEWYPKWKEHVKHLSEYGFDFWVINDHEFVRRLCKEKLDIDINIPAGTRKAADFDPFYGIIFEDYLKDYDFWGHTNLDLVLGRLDRFVSDKFLETLDVFGNDPNAICGPFSLYRNIPVVNNLALEYDKWKELLEETTVKPAYGFDEGTFSEMVVGAHNAGRLRFKSAFWQSHDKQSGHLLPRIKILEDGTLWDEVKNEETMMFHFNRSRQWPL